MSRFAALRLGEDDESENEEEESPQLQSPFDKLTPQYSFEQIINLYATSPKDPNLIGDSFKSKKFENIFVRNTQPPECNSFTPPASEINSTIYLPGKNFQRQGPQQNQKKGTKVQPKAQQFQQQNQNCQNHKKQSPLNITINTNQGNANHQQKNQHPRPQKSNEKVQKPQNHNQNLQPESQTQTNSTNSEITANHSKIEKPPSQPQHIQQQDQVKTQKYNEEQGIMWYYKDPVDNVLGPYPSSKMKEWFDCRYIDKSLLVRQADVEGKFQSIATIFPDLSQAFRDEVKQKREISFSNPSVVSSQTTMKKDVNALFAFSLNEDEENRLIEEMKLK